MSGLASAIAHLCAEMRKLGIKTDDVAINVYDPSAARKIGDGMDWEDLATPGVVSDLHGAVAMIAGVRIFRRPKPQANPVWPRIGPTAAREANLDDYYARRTSRSAPIG